MGVRYRSLMRSTSEVRQHGLPFAPHLSALLLSAFDGPIPSLTTPRYVTEENGEL
jgi:hypothetical protein